MFWKSDSLRLLRTTFETRFFQIDRQLAGRKASPGPFDRFIQESKQRLMAQLVRATGEMEPKGKTTGELLFQVKARDVQEALAQASDSLYLLADDHPRLWMSSGAHLAAGDTEQALRQVEMLQARLVLRVLQTELARDPEVTRSCPGAACYAEVVTGRVRVIDRLIRRNKKGPLTEREGRLWSHLRMSTLGREPERFRGRVQQHLDFLAGLSPRDGEPPLQVLRREMIARWEDYTKAVTSPREDHKLPGLVPEVQAAERAFYGALEAWAFLSGRLTTPPTWPSKKISASVAVLRGVGRVFGIESPLLDGVMFPPLHTMVQVNKIVLKFNGERTERLSWRASIETMLASVQLAGLGLSEPGEEARIIFNGALIAWCRVLCTISGTEIIIQDPDRFRRLVGQPFCLAGTHYSNMEYVAQFGLQALLGGVIRSVPSSHLLRDPVFGAVALAMQDNGFMFVDRKGGDDEVGRLQREAMENRRRWPLPFAPLVHVPGKRAPIIEDGFHRLEGPGYAPLPGGITLLARALGEAGKSALVVPLAVIGSGRIDPPGRLRKMTGQTIVVRAGEPFRIEDLPPSLEAIAERLVQDFEGLTGFPSGPRHNGERLPTIVSVGDWRSVRREVKRRVRSRDRKNLRDLALVFPFSEESGHLDLLRDILDDEGWPKNKPVTAFYRESDSDSPQGYTFRRREVRRG